MNIEYETEQGELDFKTDDKVDLAAPVKPSTDLDSKECNLCGCNNTEKEKT